MSLFEALGFVPLVTCARFFPSSFEYHPRFEEYSSLPSTLTSACVGAADLVVSAISWTS